MKLSKHALWGAVALVLITIAAYQPLWQNNFIDYDDRPYIIENPNVTAGLTWNGMRWAFSSGYQSNWHPLTWISHMVDAQLFGLNPTGHHLVSLLFHIAGALLLFGALFRATQAFGPSLFTAGLFATHPSHVESVAWAAERKDVLSALLWMLTMWAYVAYARRPGPWRYVTVVLFFALGLMAKPMLVTLPFVLLLMDIWPLERLSSRNIRSLILEKAPLLALTLASSIVTYQVQRMGGAVRPFDQVQWTVRLSNAALAYMAYIRDMVWPTQLAPFYPFSVPFSTWRVGAAIVVLAGSIVAVAAWRRLPKYVVVGWFWYLGTLVPVIGVIQVGLQSRADRYTYLPMIGLYVIIAFGAADIVRRWPRARIPMVSVAAVSIMAAVIATRAQVGYWKDSVSLWTRCVAVTSRNAAAHNNLAFALANKGKPIEALDQFSEALRIAPRYALAHYNKASVLANLGELDEAITELQAAIAVRPDYANAHNNLAMVLFRKGQTDMAIHHYTEAIRLDPDHPRARHGLALAQERLEALRTGQPSGLREEQQ